MNEVFMYFGVFGGASLVTMGFVIWKRATYQQQADTHTQVRVLPSAGKSYTALGKVEGAMISVPPNAKRNRPGLLYPIASCATYEADYPSNNPFAFMRTNIKEICVWEYNWEPCSNPTDEPLMSPAKLYNYVNEKFSSQTVQASQALAEAETKLQKALTRSANPMVLYVMIAFSLVLAAYNVFLMMPIAEQLTQVIDFVKAVLQ